MPQLIEKVFDSEAFRRNGHEVVDLLADYLHAVYQRQLPAIPWMEPAQGLLDWGKKLGNQHPSEVFADLIRSVIDSSVHLHHPRYMGHQINPPAPLAALAGLAVDLLNNGMGVYEMGMAGTVMEKAVMKTVAAQMQLPGSSDGFMTSGGTLANLTAMLAARSKLAPSAVWESGAKEPLALLVSEEAHYCIDRAARIMGWGEEGVIKVPVDEQYRLRTDLLESYLQKARAAGRTVVAVVGCACSTSTGAFDDLEAIGQFCRKHQLWFHVDGAHGAALAFSEDYNYLLNGIQQADSVVMDFHKMLLAPATATALLFAHANDAYHTFHQRAQYLWAESENIEWHNLAKRTFECTKSMMSLKVFTILHTYGIGLWNEYTTSVCQLGKTMADMILAHPSFELAIQPQCNIVCFRYLPKGYPHDQLNALQLAIRQKLIEQGDFYIVQTQLGGKNWLRVTLANPFTTPKDLEELLRQIEKLAV